MMSSIKDSACVRLPLRIILKRQTVYRNYSVPLKPTLHSCRLKQFPDNRKENIFSHVSTYNMFWDLFRIRALGSASGRILVRGGKQNGAEFYHMGFNYNQEWHLEGIDGFSKSPFLGFRKKDREYRI